MPLYIVATPIGNLRDLTERAREVLASCDAVVAEDTRHSGQLLRHLNIRKPLLSLPAFDEAGRAGPIVERLRAGASIALVTDAGTPSISDPGALLVRRAVEAQVLVVPVPGACAAVAAVCASGFPEGRFHFAGFLPRKASARAAMLQEIADLRAQLVFYEAPGRLHATLLALAEALGDRAALVARELTKLHEELARGPLSTLAQRFQDEVRGEVVIVVAGAPEPPPIDEAELAAQVAERLVRGEGPKEIAEALRAHGKREVYQLALRLRRGQG